MARPERSRAIGAGIRYEDIVVRAPFQRRVNPAPSPALLWNARFDELHKLVEELKRKEKVDGCKKRE
jgi:hypothetical protein